MIYQTGKVGGVSISDLRIDVGAPDARGVSWAVAWCGGRRRGGVDAWEVVGRGVGLVGANLEQRHY